MVIKNFFYGSNMIRLCFSELLFMSACTHESCVYDINKVNKNDDMTLLYQLLFQLFQ